MSHFFSICKNSPFIWNNIRLLCKINPYNDWTFDLQVKPNKKVIKIEPEYLIYKVLEIYACKLLRLDAICIYWILVKYESEA